MAGLKPMSNITESLTKDFKMRIENPCNELFWSNDTLCQLGLDLVVKEKEEVKKPRKINLRVWE